MEISILGITIAIFFVICAIDGLKKGLVAEVIRLITTIIGFVILFILLKAIGNVMHGSYLHLVTAVMVLGIILGVHKIIDIILESCEIVSKLPVISWINRLAGAVFGIVQGLIGIWVCFIVIGYFNIPLVQPWIMQQVEQSKFLGILYHSNIIIYFLRQIVTV